MKLIVFTIAMLIITLYMDLDTHATKVMEYISIWSCVIGYIADSSLIRETLKKLK